MPVTIDPHVALTWIERVAAGARGRERDEIAIEEPLEIRVDGAPVAVTMRTPGEDDELAVGFLAGEALIADPGDIEYAGPTDDLAANVVEVRTTGGLRRDPAGERSFHLTSSCGVCGKAALEHVRLHAPVRAVPVQGSIEPQLVLEAPERAREGQDAFDRTGGLHATALFDQDGGLLALREDVGRHNALDKLTGGALLRGEVPLHDRLVLVSGRTSYEIVQKCLAAAVPIICAISAPSSLAVALAQAFGITLIGFLRGDRFNIYTAPERIATRS